MASNEKIVIANDHGGLNLKKELIPYLKTNYPNLEIIDMGTHNSESTDYPDYAEKAVQTILNQEAEKGILICGTGIGMSIKANRYKGIRASLVFNEYTAEVTRAHNNSNIICLGERTLTSEIAKRILKIWLNTPFEGGRHQKRIDKLDS